MSDTAANPDLHDKTDASIAAARRYCEGGLRTDAGGNLPVRLDARRAIAVESELRRIEPRQAARNAAGRRDSGLGGRVGAA